MKSNPKNIRKWFLTLIALVILIPVVWVLVVRYEGEKPAVEIKLDSPALGLSKSLAVSFSDSKSGLRTVWVGLVSSGKEFLLHEKSFPSSGFIGGGDVERESFDLEVKPREIGVPDGSATLRIVARDYSWRGRFGGNQTIIEKPIIIDTKPPAVSVLTRFHNIAQGGSGLIIYRVSEPCLKTGVSVGDQFYPGFSGYFKDPHIWMTFFALGYEQDADTKMFVEVVDRAENRSVRGFPHYVIKKRFRKDRLNISDRFLASKMPEFTHQISAPPDASLLDIFLKVNRDLRKANYEKVAEQTGSSDTQLHWNGAFLRLPNSARRAGFADHREYICKGKEIDQQVHLGIDLASIAHSMVPAANAGRIAFVGPVGIYGNTVLIDHGFGLFSMYSHLSEITIQKGQTVAKGDEIGRTGSTGLAGGDHLHFAMMIHHKFVNPVEWWDAAWIENNVSSKIRDTHSG